MIPTAYINTRSFRRWATTHWKHLGIAGAIVPGAVALLYFIVWVASARLVTVKVDDISWMYITNLRQRETRHASGWGYPRSKGFYKEPVFNRTCESRYYGEESYVCGSYTVSCGSGCSTVHYVYCSRSVYKDWCDYDYHEWPVVDFIQKTGNTHEVEWGEFTPNGPTQRIQKIESYEVNFSSADDKFQHRPANLLEFREYVPGDRWELQVGRIRRHNIEKMRKL